MANAFAMIDESLWRRDRDFRALPRVAQCTFLQLLSQRDVDCAGILTLHVDLLAKGCDELTPEDIKHDLKTLEGARFIYVDHDTDELLIRSYARRVSARSPNALKSALRLAKSIASPKLRHILAIELRRIQKADASRVADEIDPGESPSESDMQSHLKPIRTPSETGNPSERDPEPPSCSSVAEQLSPPVVGYVGEGPASDTTEPTPPALAPNEPPPFRCPKHIHDEHPPDCGACGGYRRARERWDERERAAAVEARTAEIRAQADAKARAIRDCPCCDEDGYRNGIVCDHNPDRDATNARGMAEVRAVLRGRKAESDDLHAIDDEGTPTDA